MPVCAQLRRPFGDDVKFIQYLQQKDLYKDAALALNEISPGYLDNYQVDTLNYLKGWNYYNMKSLDSSAHYLSLVKEGSPFYLKSRFFGAYNYIYLKQYAKATRILNSLSKHDSTTEVKDFEMSGIALLKKDYAAFDSLKQSFSYTIYALTSQETNFSNYKKGLMNVPKKSPVIAGLMSAVVPGSGKIYAGKTLQGIASMLPIAALALLTNESYHKRGPKSAEFYAFGSLLTVFYVGNIWGSVFAVKINREEHEKLIHQKVLLDLQIPLRTIFN